MVMLAGITAVSILCFMLVFWKIGVVEAARDAIGTAQGAMATVRAPDLDDMDRERAVQAAALRLVTLTGSLILRSAIALVAAFVPVLLAGWAGLSPTGETLDFMARWDVIVVVTVVVTLGYLAGRRFWQK